MAALVLAILRTILFRAAQLYSDSVLAKEFRKLGTSRSNPFTYKPDVQKKITRARLGRRWKERKTEKLTMDDMV